MKSKRFVAKLELKFDDEQEAEKVGEMILAAMQHPAMPKGLCHVMSAPMKDDGTSELDRLEEAGEFDDGPDVEPSDWDIN